MTQNPIIKLGTAPIAAALLFALTLAAAAAQPSTSTEIRAVLAAGILPAGEAAEIVTLRAFYGQRSYAPAWSGSPRASGEARRMLSAMEHAADEGLEPTDYHVGALLLRTAQLPSGAAEYDLLLSDAALRFARDLRTGRPELKALDHDVELPAPPSDAADSLNKALEGDGLQTFLDSLPPPHHEYTALKTALARYREIGNQDSSAGERAMQIIANMERWRWLPRTFETNYVSVNVPDQHLFVVGAKGVMLDSRVIVGRPSDPTPIFRAVARSITVNPPWNVPAGIASGEILPKLRKNPRYLAEHEMVLRDGPTGDPYGLRIDWRTMSARAFRYHIQQRPGPKNALGTLKLELPNRFNVYLHYTSAQSLFGLDSRALSHGCVRVEQILPLASYALSGDPDAAVSSLRGAIASGTTQHLALKNPLPIYFLYWTAFVDPDGVVQFRPDIYGRDQRMIAAIENRAVAQRVTMNTVECAPA